MSSESGYSGIPDIPLPPVPSTSGYTSSSGVTSTYGYNSPTPSTAPSTYARSVVSDVNDGPLSQMYFAGGSEVGSTSGRSTPGGVTGGSTVGSRPKTMKVDEVTKYRAVRYFVSLMCSAPPGYAYESTELVADTLIDRQTSPRQSLFDAMD